MGIFPIMKLIEINRKHYKQATDEYSKRFRQFLHYDTKLKVQRLKSRSIIVVIDHSPDPVYGITVDKLALSSARSGEQLVVINNATREVVTKGLILRVDPTKVKIKFFKPLTTHDLSQDDKPSSEQNYYRIEFDQQHIYERDKLIQAALERFKNVSCSLPIHKCILGSHNNHTDIKSDKGRVMDIGILPKPKDLQRLAIEQSMRKRISLIEGPPGTGKTCVAAHIACNLSRLRRQKILLCSPIQSTVDRLAKMVEHVDGLRIVQLPSKIVTQGSSSIRRCNKESENYNLNVLVNKTVYWMSWKRCKEHFRATRRLEDDRSLEEQAIRMVKCCSKWLRRKVERRILNKADIICCTLLQAGSPILKGISFDVLIIDDVHMATEIDCLVPIMLPGLKQVTLLSDIRRDLKFPKCLQNSTKPNHNELKKELTNKVNSFSSKSDSLKKTPRTGNKGAIEARPSAELGGLFERWLSIGLSAVALRYQYRMHETVSAFVNHHFYLSRIKNDATADEKMTKKIRGDLLMNEESLDWLPKKECLTALFNASESAVSDTAQNIVNKLVSVKNVRKPRLGLIVNTLANVIQCPKGVDYGTIEDFIGQERDFIILVGLDMKMEDSNLGNAAYSDNFLLNDTALNIALSRARLGLFIIADLKNLSQPEDSTLQSSQPDAARMYCKSWIELVRCYKENKLIA